MTETAQRLQRIFEDASPREEDLVFLLSREEEGDLKEIFSFADSVRCRFMGEGVLFRGIVEFSSRCRNACGYCGLMRTNEKLKRYRMSAEEILQSASRIAENRVKTVVLQSGEDEGLDPFWMKDVILEIKRRFDMAVTLCVGEKPRQDYEMWREAGADRYLLKIETTDRRLYGSLHPGMSFENRLRCLRDLKDLGYQTGSGNIIGLKGQTLETIARDILFFREFGLEMIGIGPFIPHGGTPLAKEKKGEPMLTLKALALTRIAARTAHLPATTALGSMERDYRLDGLSAGANVIMPNFTPLEYRKLYEIYPGKKCIDEEQGACIGCMEPILKSMGRFMDFSRGDAVKPVLITQPLTRI